MRLVKAMTAVITKGARGWGLGAGKDNTNPRIAANIKLSVGGRRLLPLLFLVPSP
jgi:hypothetical protein